jgi:hypothetical protein
VHLAWVTHAYVDLDIYRSPELHGLKPDDMVREIIGHCDDEDIPPRRRRRCLMRARPRL